MKTTKENIQAVLETLKTTGRIFTVTFTKKDGSLRKLTGRFGVTKYLKGGKSTIPENLYFTVFDLGIKEYRAVNKNTIVSLKANGTLLEV